MPPRKASLRATLSEITLATDMLCELHGVQFSLLGETGVLFWVPTVKYVGEIERTVKGRLEAEASTLGSRKVTKVTGLVPDSKSAGKRPASGKSKEGIKHHRGGASYRKRKVERTGKSDFLRSAWLAKHQNERKALIGAVAKIGTEMKQSPKLMYKHHGWKEETERFLAREKRDRTRIDELDKLINDVTSNRTKAWWLNLSKLDVSTYPINATVKLVSSGKRPLEEGFVIRHKNEFGRPERGPKEPKASGSGQPSAKPAVKASRENTPKDKGGPSKEQSRTKKVEKGTVPPLHAKKGKARDR